MLPLNFCGRSTYLCGGATYLSSDTTNSVHSSLKMDLSNFVENKNENYDENIRNQ